MAKPTGRRWTLLLTVMATVLISVPTAVWASHQFTDVPDSHIFHTGISWMKDHNITVGCNPPANTQYCPDDNVTRGEMATFMKRLAENQVVDAGSLQSRTGADMRVLNLGGWTYSTGAATINNLIGPQLPESGDGGVGVTFLVPRGHDPSDPLVVVLLLVDDDFGVCGLRLITQGVGSITGSTASNFINWHGPGTTSPTMTFNAPPSRDNHSIAFQLAPDVSADFGVPGTAHTFAIYRQPGDGADTCTGNVNIAGAQLHY
jgi:hypothetical protein